VATLIKNEIGIEPEIVVGGRGEFTVWVGDETVARKDSDGFPPDAAIVASVRKALGLPAPK
jgi:hypothetical protein